MRGEENNYLGVTIDHGMLPCGHSYSGLGGGKGQRSTSTIKLVHSRRLVRFILGKRKKKKKGLRFLLANDLRICEEEHRTKGRAIGWRKK